MYHIKTAYLLGRITLNNFSGAAVIQKGRKHVHSKKKIITPSALLCLYGLHTDGIIFGVRYSWPRDTRISIHWGMAAALYSLKCPDTAQNGPKSGTSCEKTPKFAQDSLAIGLD